MSTRDEQHSITVIDRRPAGERKGRSACRHRIFPTEGERDEALRGFEETVGAEVVEHRTRTTILILSPGEDEDRDSSTDPDEDR